MKLYLPYIGDQLRLTKPWTVLIPKERRNLDLYYKLHGEKRTNFDWYQQRELEKRWISAQMTLPVGTILKVDRIYINRYKAFASITFRTEYKDQLLGTIKGRFWVNIDQANTIEFQPVL